MQLALVVVGLLSIAVPASRASAQAEPSVDSLIRSGETHREHGAWDAAARDFSKALALARQTGRLENERWLREALVQARGSLATQQFEAGDYRSARSGYRQVLEWATELGQAGNAAVASYQCGKLHRLLGELDQAQQVLLALVQQTPPVLSPAELVVVWNELGLVHGEAGRLDERLRCHERALAIAIEADARQAETLVQLVEVHTLLGDASSAFEVQERALDSALETGDVRIAAHGRANLAFLHYLSGDATQALAVATSLLPEIEQVSDDEALLSTLDTIVRAALALGDLATGEQALARAESVLQRPERASLTPDERSRWRARHHAWEFNAQDLLAARLSAEQQPSRRAALVLEGLRRAERWKASALIELLARGAPPDDFHLDALRAAAVPADGVLIEYASGWERLYAYVLTEQGLEHVCLGPRAEIEAEAKAYVQDLRQPGSRAAIARRGRELYRALLGPLLHAVAEATDLVVVPTPALAGLPFEALVVDGDPPSDDTPRMSDLTFVLDRHVVRYAASAEALARIAGRPRRALLDQLLVLADPLYSDESLDQSGELRIPSDAEPVARLEQSRAEALALADEFLAKHPATSARHYAALGQLRVRRSFAFTEHPAIALYVGSEASPRVFEGDLRGPTLIHVAAHAFADEVHPESSRLVLAFEQDFGPLSMPRIEALDMDAELVVLSACETASGNVRPGDGVLSLARAFLNAGARAVVASLWVVYDDKASATMETFTRLLVRDGVDPAVALREAKLALRRDPGMRKLGKPIGATVELESAHPCFWAPFVYVGR